MNLVVVGDKHPGEASPEANISTAKDMNSHTVIPACSCSSRNITGMEFDDPTETTYPVPAAAGFLR